jgi:hypothetical protein
MQWTELKFQQESTKSGKIMSQGEQHQYFFNMYDIYADANNALIALYANLQPCIIAEPLPD